MAMQAVGKDVAEGEEAADISEGWRQAGAATLLHGIAAMQWSPHSGLIS